MWNFGSLLIHILVSNTRLVMFVFTTMGSSFLYRTIYCLGEENLKIADSFLYFRTSHWSQLRISLKMDSSKTAFRVFLSHCYIDSCWGKAVNLKKRRRKEIKTSARFHLGKAKQLTSSFCIQGLALPAESLLHLHRNTNSITGFCQLRADLTWHETWNSLKWEKGDSCEYI